MSRHLAAVFLVFILAPGVPASGQTVGWRGDGSGGVVMDPGYDETGACVIQMGTPDGKLAPEIRDAKAALPYAMDYREPAKIEGATLVTNEPGDFNKDGFNESEGCHVLKGPGPLSFTYQKGKGAGFAPVFKVLDWKDMALTTVSIDGKEVPAPAGIADSNLILQVLGTIKTERAEIRIAK